MQTLDGIDSPVHCIDSGVNPGRGVFTVWSISLGRLDYSPRVPSDYVNFVPRHRPPSLLLFLSIVEGSRDWWCDRNCNIVYTCLGLAIRFVGTLTEQTLHKPLIEFVLKLVMVHEGTSTAEVVSSEHLVQLVRLFLQLI